VLSEDDADRLVLETIGNLIGRVFATTVWFASHRGKPTQPVIAFGPGAH